MATVDWAALRAAATEAMRRAYAPYSVSGGRGGAGRRRPGRGRLQRRERLVRRDAVRRVRPGVGAARHRRRPAGRDVLCGRCRGAADAVRALPAAAVGARWPGVPGRPRGRPAADGRAAAARVRPGRSRSGARTGGRCPHGAQAVAGPGTVFVHPDSAGGERVWTAYWERSAGFDDDTAADARASWRRVHCGRTRPTRWPGVVARTPRVVVVRRGRANCSGPAPTDAPAEVEPALDGGQS